MEQLDAWLVHLRASRDIAEFNRAARNPEDAQKQVLQTILKANKDTDFGKQHGFSSIEGPSDFADSVPIQGYEDVEPWVRQMTEGKSNILTREEPYMYATTSGTTRNPKLIPVTHSSQNDLRKLIRVWLSSALKDYPEMFHHGILTVTSPEVEDYTAQGVPMGSMSGLTRRKTPTILRKRYVIPIEVNEVADYDIRYFLLARLAFGTPVSAIITPNPSTVLRLIRVGQEDPERLIDAIHQGTLGIPSDVLEEQPEDQLALLHSIEKTLKPAPARAGFLETVTRRYGYLCPKGVWPELAIIACWLGGSAGIQAREMRSHFEPDLAVRDLGFRATEATVTVPLENDTPAGALALQANYYEFIREDDIHVDNPPTLQAHQLETGGRYYLILTTSGGLYRYDINDVIVVEGWYEKTPRIAFLRKGRDMVNITGEKLHLNQVVEAASEAAEQLDFRWTQLQLIPDAKASTYDLLLEPSNPEAEVHELEEFLRCFDRFLSEFNVEYRTKRDSRRLGIPRLHHMKKGWAHRKHRRDVVGKGKRDSQHKWPVIQMEWEPAIRSEVVRTLVVDEEEESR